MISGQGTTHLYEAKYCPNCHSRRIHKRKGFHWFSRWKCRRCHSKFFNPLVVEVYVDSENWHVPKYKTLMRHLQNKRK